MPSTLCFSGKLVSLREQQLLDCDVGNVGCSGGWIYDANKYVIRYGPMSEQSYPYYGHASICRYNSSEVVARVSKNYQMPPGDESALNTTSARIGPIEVCIEVTDSFSTYSSGVYYNRDCQGQVNPAVLLVGYGTDPKGGDDWLVINSWGAKWGDNGYIKMGRNRGNMCKIASYATYVLV